MNSINGTIDLLLSLVAREQRNADAAQPHDPAEEYRQQLQALLHSRQDDPASLSMPSRTNGNSS